jgi:hypothetical protein
MHLATAHNSPKQSLRSRARNAEHEQKHESVTSEVNV